jgi:GGDEF domain-containing protein
VPIRDISSASVAFFNHQVGNILGLIKGTRSFSLAKFAHDLAYFFDKLKSVADCKRLPRVDQALKVLSIEDINLIVLDPGLPDALDFESIEQLRYLMPEVPIIVYSGAVEFLPKEGLGIQAFFEKDTRSPEVLLKTIQLAIAQKRMNYAQHDSGIDEPTGLFNRSGFFSVANEALHLSISSESDFCVLYLTTGSGQETDDRVASQMIERMFRQTDILARIDQGEFLVGLSGLSPQHKDNIERRLTKNANRSGCKLSYGVAYLTHARESLAEMVSSARETRHVKRVS